MNYSYWNELYHHGILGQRWGKKNGPPYPLQPADHSSSEMKAGWRKSLKSDPDLLEKKRAVKEAKKSSKLNQKNPLDVVQQISKDSEEQISQKIEKDLKEKVTDFINSDGFKKGLKITIAAAATYAACKIGKKYLQKYAVELLRAEYESLPRYFNSLSSIPKSPFNYHDAYFNSTDTNAWKRLLSGINHGVDMSNLLDHPGRNVNCTFNSAAIIMRLKGYEATAAELNNGAGLPREVVQNWFKNAKFVIPKIKNPKKLYNFLLSKGEGNYGMLSVQFKNGGGHSVVYTVKNGAVQILDGQLNMEHGNSFESINSNLFKLCNISATQICDLTNCDPSEYILNALMG